MAMKLAGRLVLDQSSCLIVGEKKKEAKCMVIGAAHHVQHAVA